MEPAYWTTAVIQPLKRTTSDSDLGYLSRGNHNPQNLQLQITLSMDVFTMFSPQIKMRPKNIFSTGLILHPYR